MELDEYAKEIHHKVGESVINNKIDVLITVGENAKETYNVGYDAGIKAYHYDSNEEMIKEIDYIIEHDDVILVKGSHGMHLTEVVEYLKESSE